MMHINPRLHARIVVLIMVAALLCSRGLLQAQDLKGGAGLLTPPPPKTTSRTRSTQPARAPRPSASVSNTGARRKSDDPGVEIAYWQTIKNSTDPEDFRAYLKDFP